MPVSEAVREGVITTCTFSSQPGWQSPPDESRYARVDGRAVTPFTCFEDAEFEGGYVVCRVRQSNRQGELTHLAFVFLVRVVRGARESAGATHRETECQCAF